MDTSACKADFFDEEDIPVSKRSSKKIYNTENNSYFTKDLINTPLFNDDLMENIYTGIVQNIIIEMDKRHLTIRGLAWLAGVNYSMLSKVCSFKSHISLKYLIKLAYALKINPVELFPYDSNKRMTNGDRFDEITKGMDTSRINFLLDMATGCAKLNNNTNGCSL